MRIFSKNLTQEMTANLNQYKADIRDIAFKNGRSTNSKVIEIVQILLNNGLVELHDWARDNIGVCINRKKNMFAINIQIISSITKCKISTIRNSFIELKISCTSLKRLKKISDEDFGVSDDLENWKSYPLSNILYIIQDRDIVRRTYFDRWMEKHEIEYSEAQKLLGFPNESWKIDMLINRNDINDMNSGVYLPFSHNDIFLKQHDKYYDLGDDGILWGCLEEFWFCIPWDVNKIEVYFRRNCSDSFGLKLALNSVVLFPLSYSNPCGMITLSYNGKLCFGDREWKHIQQFIENELNISYKSKYYYYL